MKAAVRISFLNESIKERLKKTADEIGCQMVFLGDEEPDVRDIEDYDILFGKFKASMLKNVKNLKWYQLPSAGVDGFTDDSIYPNADVVLTNGSGAYGVTIAEHQILNLLMLMRKAPQYIEGQKNKAWKNLGDVRSIFGSTIAVVGTGNLGSEFAKRVQAMGAKVIGVRRTGNALENGFDEMYHVAELD